MSQPSNQQPEKKQSDNSKTLETIAEVLGGIFLFALCVLIIYGIVKAFSPRDT